jgi:hypothetical protein
METKVCKRCGEEKEFHENPLRKYACKECIKKDQKETYNRNRVKIREQQKKYKEENREKINRNQNEAAKKNKDKKAKTDKAYYEKNKGHIKERVKRYERENRKEVSESKRVYALNKRKEDINFKLAGVLRARLNTAIKRRQKSGSAVRDLGCSIEELKKYLESKFQLGVSWDNHGEWHIDHIRPLASFNLEDRQQLLEACNYTNLQPLWAHDNLVKSDKLEVT